MSGMMNEVICVVGLGYVGLPLALEFGKKGFRVIGFDVNTKRISELKNNCDSLGESSDDEIRSSNVEFSSDPSKIKEASFIIVCVPTPITLHKKPDLGCVESASKLVGQNLNNGSMVVFESTVYPGVTDDVCLPILEADSGLNCPVDFKIGYSPERINPGDKEHTIDKVAKIVSGVDAEALERVANVYSKITSVFRAKSIKVAEAAKVIENVQRDLNIALMNELSLIFSRMDIDTRHVLEAAYTKWNFHRYHPGLVGGHCIGVDPYYLTFKAEELGFHPQVILAGRATNDHMAKHVAELMVKALNSAGKVIKDSKVLLLGLTFKENVRDARNSKAKDIINELKDYGVKVVGFDPNLDDDSVRSFFGVEPVDLSGVTAFDGLIVVNKHSHFGNITLDTLKEKMSDNPVIVDAKNLFDKDEALSKGFVYRCL